MSSEFQFDLVVLTACKDQRVALETLLSKRAADLGIHPVRATYLVDPNKDPGCRGAPDRILRQYLRSAHRALVVFDREGSGRETRSPDQLEEDVSGILAANGWEDRGAAVVLDPELEQWVWSDSSHVDRILGWRGRTPPLRDWLVSAGWVDGAATKPARPKDAFRAAIRQTRQQLSSSLFGDLAESVNFSRCQDRSFLRLRAILQDWFPAA